MSSAPAASRDITQILNAERAAHAGKLHPFATTTTTAPYQMLTDVFPVGKTSGFTVDTARGAPRAIALAGDVGAQPADRDLVPGRSGAISSTDTFWATARAGHFPLVVFAPGFDSNPDTYQPFLHAIAAQGFIVAAPVFPDRGLDRRRSTGEP